MDGWMHCWLVGGWIETKKWMVAWMDIYIYIYIRKNMDGYMDRKHGWLDGLKKMDGWMVGKKYESWMDRKNIYGWLDGYETIDG